MDRITSFTGDYAWLSNFFGAAVEFEGVTYPTVEHAYQAAKTLDPRQRASLLRLATPGQAKRAGLKVTLRPGWDGMKLEVMRALLHAKFTRHPDLRDRLLATGQAHLEEGNDWGDTYWGTVGGRGQNQLGRLLMRVRRELGDAPG